MSVDLDRVSVRATTVVSWLAGTGLLALTWYVGAQEAAQDDVEQLVRENARQIRQMSQTVALQSQTVSRLTMTVQDLVDESRENREAIIELRARGGE